MDEIRKISQNSIILSALLIFFGFKYFHSYYNRFNLEYYSYVSASEIIFSFLPIIIPLLIPIVFILIFAFDTPIKNWDFFKWIRNLKLTKFSLLNKIIKFLLYIILFLFISVLSAIIFFTPIGLNLSVPFNYVFDLRIFSYFYFDLIIFFTFFYASIQIFKKKGEDSFHIA